jgi:hypothetical protein
MLARLATLVMIAFLSPMAQVAADDPDDLIARAQRLCDREHVVLVVADGVPDGAPAHYIMPDNCIRLSQADVYWHSPATRYRMRATRVVSTWHRDHIIMHEIAHAKLYSHIGMARCMALHQRPLGIDPTRVASVVSSYAATGPPEFVAEVYVGIWCGLSYPPDVMTYYESLWRQE